MTAVELSVIIASYNSRNTIGACLASLERQPGPDGFEIIVIDSSTDGTAEFVEQYFPDVSVFHFAERKFCGDARNIGISLARGKVIAFVDADCLVAVNWVEEILSAHESAALALGGAIANGNPDSYVGWAAYFTEFSKWMPGTPAKMMPDIAAANMSYKKEALEKYGKFIEGTYCSDTEFHWRLAREGHGLGFTPSIMVSHCNIDHLGKFLRHEIFHGQSFARVRSRAQGFSRWKRIAYLLFIPFVTIKIFLQIGWKNLTNRVYLKHFIKTLPLVTLGVICWSLGEAIGYARYQP